MATRTWLGIVAGGMALAAFPAPAPVAVGGVLVAVMALLAACTGRHESAPRPSPDLLWASALTLAGVLVGAFFLRDSSPLGFLWLLGPGFVFAAPLFLYFFARSAGEE